MPNTNCKQTTELIRAAEKIRNLSTALRAVPGNYTGLQVVCFRYVALEQVAPGQDSGFDMKAEYEEALRMFKSSNR